MLFYILKRLGVMCMKRIPCKRILSGLLALVMVLSLCSWGATEAQATAYTGVLSQHDSRWGSYNVNGGTISATGCGILSLVNAVGYLSGKQMDVIDTALWAYRIGAFNPGGAEGTYRTAMYWRVESVYGQEYGITLDCDTTGEGYWEGAYSTRLKNHLLKGGAAVGHVYNHFIAIVGYDAATNKFHLYDSSAAAHRGTNYNNGDVWVTEAAFSRGTLDLDWFVLISSTKKQETWIEKACFDVMVYRDRNKDLSHMTDAQLKEHWLEYGIKEGRPSSTILDLAYYRSQNKDLQEAFGTDYTKYYEHFISSGYQEKRKSSMLFDGAYYTTKYPDVEAKYDGPYLKHYVENGIYEGRRASKTFDPNYYWVIRPDVAQAWPGDYAMCAKHYAGHGINDKVQAYDGEAPVITDATISDVSASGYTVTCTVTDNWGVSKVVFPSWTVDNGVDDLADDFMNTQKGTQSGSTYIFRVRASDHSNHIGPYVTHIYAVDKGGNQTILELDPVTVDDPAPDPEPEIPDTPSGSSKPTEPHEVLILKSNASCQRNESLLTNITLGTTVQTVVNQFTNGSLTIRNCYGKVLSSSDPVGTGSTVELYTDGILMDRITIAVLGDVDGNGELDVTDYMRVKAAILKKVQLTPAQVAAADVDGTGLVNTTDYMRIKSHFLGTYDLEETLSP